MGVLAVFNDQGRWGDTLVCEEPIAALLAALGWRFGAPGSEPPAGVSADAVRLVYLRVEGGHYGLLCEPGEWVAPPGGDGTAAPSRAPFEVPAGLPSLDGFIETMLELSGHTSEGGMEGETEG